MDVDSMRATLSLYGQDHLLQFWPQLSDEERSELWRDINEINFAEVTDFFRYTMDKADKDEEKLDERLQPIPPELHGAVTRTSSDLLRHYDNLALDEISEGRVGVLLLAGGQGTRLGVDYPKGMYDVGLPSHKTLYQLQAERLFRLQQLAELKTGRKGAITWYIMTSQHTKEPTWDYFRRNNYFGLDQDQLVVFEQGMLPCFTFDGKIIMES